MSTITDYASLQAALADWLNRTDLTATLPTFIQLTEARIRRVIRTRSTTVQTVSTVAGTNTVTVPAGIIEVREIVVDNSSNGLGGGLDLVSMSEIVKRWARQGNVQAMPELAHIMDSTVYLAPVPDSAYTLYLTCEGPFTALSNSNTTNWVLLGSPDVYLYGALLESAPYLKDDDRAGLWEARFQKALEELRDARDRAEWPSTPVQRPPAAFS